MHPTDKKILQLLQSNADLSIADIAKQVNLSASPCWSRIQKLQKNGFIKSKVALLNADLLNIRLVAFVQIKTIEHNMKWANRFIAVIHDMPEVVEMHRMSGDVDYLLKVMVPDIQAFDDFYQRLTNQVSLTDVSSSFAMESIKYSHSLPLNYV